MSTSIRSGTFDSALQINGVDAIVFNAGGITSKIQSLTATVNANALTITLNPTVLDFRSTTLGNGVPNTRLVNSAISVVVPNTATLGTSDGVLSRLLVLAIDNAGTVELAVVNSAGFSDSTETALISTTAISVSADSATVVYSTTGRTSVPYRVVGYVESTQSTAGTWATSPSAVQGVGGREGIVTSTDDITSNATYYPLSVSSTGVPLQRVYTSSTKLTLNPSTGILTAVGFFSSSDKNLKTDIKTIPNALDTILQVEGVSFNWTETGISSYGVIAQQLEQVIPDIVHTSPDNGQKSVEYTALIPFLVESIKELANRVKELESK